MVRGSRAGARYQPLAHDQTDVELEALDPSSCDNVKTSLDGSDDASIHSSHGLTASKQGGIEDEYGGAALMEGVVAVWDKRGKYCFIAGLALLIIVFELDNSTTGSYETYALSDFKALSMQGTLDVIAAIVSAGVKIPIAKVSDVIGRGETYCLMVSLLMVSYIAHAAAQGFASFLLGSVLYIVGQAGIALLNFIIVSDVTSMRSRALAGNLLYSPFLIITWLSGILVDHVKNGIGWRWGYGMFVFITPVGALLLVVTLMNLQRKARLAGYATSRRTKLRQFCSRIDLGGSLLLSGGIAMILLPITLAAQSHDHWKSAWVFVSIITGAALLIALVPYEAFYARHPVLPVAYLRMRAITIPFLILSIDACGYRITHTYLFAWAVASHDFSARNALYLSYISGLTQLLTGIVVGVLIYRARSFKWLCIGGSIVRALGYGLMLRVRTNSSTIAELFAVQMIQGLGSGFLETSMFLAAQMVISHVELAQVTALIAMSAHTGGGIGSAVAGGIYTTTMKARLRARLGTNADDMEINDVYDSITGTLPDWESQDRQAVAAAYSDVMGYMTTVALYVALPVILLVLFMPDNKLRDGKNLQEDPNVNVDRSSMEQLRPG